MAVIQEWLSLASPSSSQILSSSTNFLALFFVSGACLSVAAPVVVCFQWLSVPVALVVAVNPVAVHPESVALRD